MLLTNENHILYRARLPPISYATDVSEVTGLKCTKCLLVNMIQKQFQI